MIEEIYKWRIVMTRNKVSEFKIIQQIAGKNAGAVNVLCACADKDRFDLVEFIRAINKKDPNNGINPDMILKIYEEKCKGDIDLFIALLDKQFKAAKEMRKLFDF
jgi:hypothetical protein